MAHNALIDEACEKGYCAMGQNLGHMPRIYHICSKLRPKVIVETGVGAENHGSSTYTFLIIAKEMNAELYSLDVDKHNEWFQNRFPDLDYSHWHFILGRSVESLKALDVKIDFLHLDSDHGGGYVTDELNAAKPHLATVNVITSHDTEQTHTRVAITGWATENNYTIKEFGNWHGQVFITTKAELFEGLV